MFSNLQSKRGSFLNRSEKVLNKLAQISSNTGLNENPIGSSKGKKSMVFAVISPPKMEEELKEEVSILWLLSVHLYNFIIFVFVFFRPLKENQTCWSQLL